MATAVEWRPRALAFADAVLVAGGLFFAANLFFAFQLQRSPAIEAAAAVLVVVFWGVRARASPTRRLEAALAAVPFLLGLFAYAAYVVAVRPPAGAAAARAGRAFDPRSLWEVLVDVRRSDARAQSFITPHMLLTRRPLLTWWQDAAEPAILRTVAPDWGLEVDGTRALPLAGVSLRTTVHANEGGTRVVYQADEHGFNNPRGLWEASPLQLAAIGDSYTFGTAVPPEQNYVARLRDRYPRTLGVAMPGSGPLIEYALLKEFVADRRPGIVVWAYFHNDLADLAFERQCPLLRRYLDEPDFRQGLARRQDAVDEALVRYLGEVEPGMERWPDWLAQRGVDRRVTPLFLQDLIMRERHSALAGAIRLDELSFVLSRTLLPHEVYADEPQLPLFGRVLAQARDAVASWGGRMYFVYLPDGNFLHGPEHGSRRAVLQLARSLGLPVIDVHPAFQAQPRAASLWFSFSTHCNPAGYRLIGDTILGALPEPSAGEARSSP